MNGLLEVTGRGEMFAKSDACKKPQWNDYRWAIRSAKIDVEGATYLNSLFDGCDSLSTIITPKKTSGAGGYLPGFYWEESDGNNYFDFTANLTQSIVIKKHIRL